MEHKIKDQTNLLEIEEKKLKKRNFAHELGRGSAGEVVRIKRDVNGTIVSSSPFDAKIYSRMKYGDPEAIRTAASDVFDLIKNEPKLLSLLQTMTLSLPMRLGKFLLLLTALWFL